MKLFLHTENGMPAFIQQDSGKPVPLKRITVVSECHGKKILPVVAVRLKRLSIDQGPVLTTARATKPCKGRTSFQLESATMHGETEFLEATVTCALRHKVQGTQ